MNKYVSNELENYLDKHMKSFECPAHDIQHVYRVANLAVKIAEEEKIRNGYDIDMKLVYIAGLVHDVLDTKLIDETESNSIEENLIKILTTYGNDEQKLSENDCKKVISIIKDVGYKNLLSPDWNPQQKSIEYKIVQDSDLLDAIGAIGVSRCMAFSGRMKRQLFGGIESDDDKENITQHQYKEQQKQNIGSSIKHFFDKLLKIKEMMLTSYGQELAKERHDFMKKFLIQIDEELLETDYNEGGNIKKRVKLY